MDPPEIIDHYRIGARLGSGGMGEVFVAVDLHLERQVAIKLPSLESTGTQYKRRFLDEARAASRLDHPNIARVYDYGETPEGRPYFVMELVKGPSLASILEAGPPPLERAVAIAQGVLGALAHAHSQGLVHRDIKPTNILLTEDDVVKVLDFGLAKHSQVAPAGSATGAPTMPLDLTQPGTVVGTPFYMSPEQACARPIDSRSDLFSAGVVLYECLTGCRAFHGATTPDVLGQVAHKDPRPPSSISRHLHPELDRVVLKALAKDPAARYQTAAEFSVALETSAAITRSGVVRRGVRKAVATSRRKAAVLGLFVLAILVGMWLWWRSLPYRSTPEAERWYQAGLAALRDSAPASAARALERAVVADPGFALAHARLADVWDEIGYTEKAKEEMLRALAVAQAPRGRDALLLDAIRSYISGDNPGAIRRFSQLAARASRTERAQYLIDLGRAYLRNDQGKAALDAYRQAVQADPRSPGAHLRAAIQLARQGQRDPAAHEFGEADSTFQTLGNIEGQIDVRHFQAQELMQRSLPAARELEEKTLQMARAISSTTQEIAALSSLAHIAIAQGRIQDGEAAANAAIEKSRHAGLPYFEAICVNDLGNAFFQQDLARAETEFQRALEVARRHGLRRAEARAQFSLASVHSAAKDLDGAVRDLQPALAYYKEGGWRTETLQCLLVLARIHRDKSDYAEALAEFDRVYQFAEPVDDRAQMALALDGMGSVLSAQARYPEALEHYRRSVVLTDQLGNPISAMLALSGQARCATALGRWEEAEGYLAEIEKRNSTSPGHGQVQAVAASRRAMLAFGRGQFREAMEALARAVRLAPNQSLRCYQELTATIAGAADPAPGACREGLASPNANDVQGARLGYARLLLLVRKPTVSGLSQASELARTAAEWSDSHGLTEDAWQAWSMVARALRAAGDEPGALKAASRAAALLARLRKLWGEADTNRYLSRADVVWYSQALH
jgi:tetratricopeptide (TPR) repeat protein